MAGVPKLGLDHPDPSGMVWRLFSRIITLLTISLVLATSAWTGRSSGCFRGSRSLGHIGYAGELGQGGFPLAAPHRPVMRMGLEMVLPAWAAEEKQNLLGVFSNRFQEPLIPTVTKIMSSSTGRNEGHGQ